MKSPPKEGGIVQRVFFQMHPPVSCLSLSDNISELQVRVNIRETERDTTFEIPELLMFRIYKSFHNFIGWQRLNLQVKICSVQILENAFIIYETTPPPWHDLINSPSF